MRKCSDECEPLCDFCINFDGEEWICNKDKSERVPHDYCEENFECFRSGIKSEVKNNG